VFLTTADDERQTQRVLAFDRKTGKALWDAVVHEKGFPRKHPKNSHASATPACDGKRLYCAFVSGDALHVSAVDLDGKFVWQTRAGAFTSQHGYCASPVLYKSLVLVTGDSLKDCYVAAFEAATGKEVWRTPRTTPGRHGNYPSPIVATVAGKPQMIMTGLGETTSYDPETGKVIWSCAGPTEVAGCTAAWNDKLVFVSGGFPEKELLAIRGDGAGDVTASHVAWRATKGVTYVPSPLYHGGMLYVVNDTGTATCFEAATGKEVWQGRLAGAFSSSPVLAGDYLYVGSEAGKVFVLRAGPKFELVATNDLGDGVFATPAVCGGRIYLRTTRALYCIGK
jgi:outer membrane protein assembly factor BamB